MKIYLLALIVKIDHFITRFNRGGTARWLTALILETKAIDVYQGLYAGYVERNEVEDSNFSRLNGKHLKGLERSPNFYREIVSFLKIRKVIKNSNADVINTHTSKAGVVGRLAALSLGKTRPALVHTFHGHLLYGYFSPLKTKIFTLIESFLAKHTDILIAAGETVKNDLLDQNIGKISQFQVIDPGISNLTFKSRAMARETFKIQDSEVVVGWLGRLEKIKAPERVIEIALKFPKIRFLVGGEGLMKDVLTQFAPENVTFLGWIEPELFWPACDIALLTSLNEAQPISAIEASKCGLPLVAENVGSVSEVVLEGKTGFLTKSKEERIWAISNLVESSELRQKFGFSAKTYVDEKYSLEQFTAKHVEVFTRAIKIHNQR